MIVNNGYLREPVKGTPVEQRLALQMSLPILRFILLRLGFELIIFRIQGARNIVTECTTAVAVHGNELKSIY